MSRMFCEKRARTYEREKKRKCSLTYDHKRYWFEFNTSCLSSRLEKNYLFLTFLTGLHCPFLLLIIINLSFFFLFFTKITTCHPCSLRQSLSIFFRTTKAYCSHSYRRYSLLISARFPQISWQKVSSLFCNNKRDKINLH